jgi:hypothetical protein
MGLGSPASLLVGPARPPVPLVVAPCDRFRRPVPASGAHRRRPVLMGS